MRRAWWVPLVCVSSLAHAQPQAVESPTAGVYNPAVGIAGDGDASAVEKNPALTGWLKSWSGVFLHSERYANGPSNAGGRGTGVFFASRLPYLTSLALGAGVQFLRPPTLVPLADSQKLTLSFAWRLHPMVSIGLSYSHLWSQHPPVSAGIDTLDLALAFRVARWAAAALVVHDVTQPMVGGLPLQRVWEPEVAFRPFGSDRLELAVGMRIGERRADVDPRVRLWITAAPGVVIKSDVEIRRDVDLDGVLENDVRVAIGLQLDLAHLGAGAWWLFGSESGSTSHHGVAVTARISGERYPAFYRGPRHLEKIDIGPGMERRKLAKLLLHLRHLERDRTILGLVVVLGQPEGGWGTAEEVRSALLRLRQAGKRVYVYLADTTTKGYYIASAAERIYLDPAGGLRLQGLTSTTYYFKGTGDLLGVKADYIKIAEYKSAPEMWTQSGPSEPAKLQREAFADDVWHHLTDAIASSRKVSAEKACALVDAGPYTAGEALKAGLVDALHAGDEVEGAIAKDLGRRVAIRPASQAPDRDRMWEKPAITVLFVDGDISDGKSYDVPVLDLHFVGMQTLLPAIQRARTDPRVQALVLRIDSPGGSAMASDVIAREIERTRAVKPVVCSLGDTAASGGYFIASACDRIFAEPSTLTGSIGIFTGKFDLSGLAQKLGVNVKLWDRGAHASMDSMFRPYTDEERTLILGKLRYYYGRFLDAVARGRKLAATQVDAVGRGRIWSGRAARAHGLVDDFGGLADAVAWAMEKTKLKPDAPVEIVAAPEEWSISSWLLGLLGIKLGSEPAAAVLTLAPGVAEMLKALPGSLLAAPGTAQARLDEQIDVR
jgi:protease-4